MNDKQQRLPASPDSEGSSLKLWLWFLVAMLLAFYWSALSVQQEAQPITYSEFKALVRSDKIAGVTFAGRQMTGTYIEGERKPGQTAHFSTLLPDIDDPELLQLLETHKVTVNAKSAEPVWWLRILFSMLPWVLVLALIFYVSSKMQERLLKGGGPGGIFGFGQSRAKRFEVTATQVSFDDVAGVDNAKRDLEEIVEFLKNPQRFRKLGAKIPRGVLLMGPPGTGKTMLAKALAGEAGVPFYSISGSEFIEMFVGVGAARVRDMFESAHKDAPAVIFIDEIDSVGRTRGTGLGGGHDEREQTLNQILGEMDGFQPHEAVVCWPPPTAPTCSTPPCCAPAASTARWCWTCRARTRGARSCRYTAAKSRWRMTSTSSWWRPEPWDFPARTWRIWSTKPRCRQPGTTRNGWTWRTFPTPATRSCWAPSGKPWPARTRRNWWPTTSRGTRSPQSSCRTPTRWTRSPSSPHGLALGATELLPEEELHNLRYSYLLDRIGVILAGRAAEQVVFGEVSSGAENDLKQATRLARLMVSQWGMSEKLGPAAFPRGEEHPFLGREMAQPRDFSEQTAQLIDEEVRALMCEREQHVRGLLEQHRRQLETLAQALLERESLSADEVSALLGGDMAVAASG